MKTVILTIVFLLSQLSFADIQTRNCAPTYGPQDYNLAIHLDDQDDKPVLVVGYENAGAFYKLNMTGCQTLTFENRTVVCDGRAIGTRGDVKAVHDDAPYNGLRTKIQLQNEAYVITGSCRPEDKDPLTIQF